LGGNGVTLPASPDTGKERYGQSRCQRAPGQKKPSVTRRIRWIPSKLLVGLLVSVRLDVAYRNGRKGRWPRGEPWEWRGGDRRPLPRRSRARIGTCPG